MKPARLLLFFAVPLGVMFTLGGLWNAALAKDFIARHAPAVARPEAEVKLGFIAVGYVVTTAFMAFLFRQSFKEQVGLVAGFQFGALFGLIMTLPVYLLLYGGWDVHPGLLLADTAWHGLEQGLGGVVMTLIFRPSPRTHAA